MNRPILAALITLLAVGCSSTSDSSTPPEPSETSTTTQSTTTTSTTTTTTTSTIDPVAEAEEAVEAAYFRSYDVFWDCYGDLPNCEPDSTFPDVYTGEALQTLTAAALQRKNDGMVIDPPDNPDHARTEILDLVLDPDGTSAEVTYCTVDGHLGFLVDDSGNRTPVGDPDTMLVARGVAEMRLDGDDWKISRYDDTRHISRQIPIEEVTGCEVL